MYSRHPHYKKVKKRVVKENKWYILSYKDLRRLRLLRVECRDEAFAHEVMVRYLNGNKFFEPISGKRAIKLGLEISAKNPGFVPTLYHYPELALPGIYRKYHRTNTRDRWRKIRAKMELQFKQFKIPWNKKDYYVITRTVDEAYKLLKKKLKITFTYFSYNSHIKIVQINENRKFNNPRGSGQISRGKITCIRNK